MISIQFYIRGTKVTWFINDNWVILISFLLTLLVSTACKIVFRKIKQLNKKTEIPNPKGGEGFIDQCIEPDSAYELVDPALQLTVRRMLDIPSEKGPLIISVPVLILAYLVRYQPLKQVGLLGLKMVVENYKIVAVKAGTGTVTGVLAAFLPVSPIPKLCGIAATLIFVASTINGIDSLECSSVVSKLAHERVYENKEIPKEIHFVETPPEKTPKIFIKGSKEVEIYGPTKNKNENVCSSEYKPEVVPRVNRNCKKEYIPLKDRTKTWADLKREDSTENRNQAKRYIERYEKRRKKIMNERVK